LIRHKSIAGKKIVALTTLCPEIIPDNKHLLTTKCFKMKRKTIGLVVVVGLVFALSSCGSKTKDADIKVAAENVLAADPACSGLHVTINDGVATITGEVKDEATKTMAQKAIADVKGVKSVENNATVAPPPPPPVVPSATETEAAALTKAVNDAIKDYPGVVATVNNQVLTLTGEVKKADLQKLMMSLNSLKAMGLKSIDSKGLVKK